MEQTTTQMHGYLATRSLRSAIYLLRSLSSRSLFVGARRFNRSTEAYRLRSQSLGGERDPSNDTRKNDELQAETTIDRSIIDRNS